jgi:hypothetical protein
MATDVRARGGATLPFTVPTTQSLLARAPIRQAFTFAVAPLSFDVSVPLATPSLLLTAASIPIASGKNKVPLACTSAEKVTGALLEPWATIRGSWVI